MKLETDSRSYIGKRVLYGTTPGRITGKEFDRARGYFRLVFKAESGQEWLCDIWEVSNIS